MEGKIVYAERFCAGKKPFGEIRVPDIRDRIRFLPAELVGIPFESCIGRQVMFDVVQYGEHARAVRVREIKGNKP